MFFEELESRLLLAAAPALSSIAAAEIGPHSAVINWLTDAAASSRVEYGPGAVNQLSTIQHSTLKTAHSVVVSGLMPATQYNFRVISTDGGSNTAVSDVYTFTTAAIPAAATGGLVPGGLTSYPVYMLGDNLVTNGSFETIAANGKPAGWSDNGGANMFADTTVARTGNNSYKVTDPYAVPFTQSATQTINVPAGSYQITGWIKTQNLTNGAVRIGFAGNTSALVSGTNDWTFRKVQNIVVASPGNQIARLEVYQQPSGMAWWDDVEVRQELPAGVDVFMQYPNYRGMLFSDQPQMARFNVKVNPPAGTSLANYSLRVMVVRDSDGATIATQNITTVSSQQAINVDDSGFVNGSTYLVRFQLVRKSDDVVAYEYPAYRISKVDAAQKASMTVYFDEHNRIVLDNEPSFIVGVYDAGMGYTTSAASWENTQFGTYRRLWDIPINMYLNYWYGEASQSAMSAMMNVLQDHGIYYLQTANAAHFPANANDAYTINLGNHNGLAGWYTMDERLAEQAPEAFAWHQRLARLDPDGMTFAVSNRPAQMNYWRDVADLLAMDPYPLFGVEPTGGYPFQEVADWTARTVAAVQGSRPVVTVLQYFQFTSNSRWPTLDELRNMTWSAIANGANGVWYWTLGISATGQSLANIGNTTWPGAKIDEYEKLKIVTREIDGISGALAAVDSPEKLLGNSNSSIRTRVKFVNGIGYLIASNYSNSNQTATFTWDSAIGNVAVYAEGRHIVPSGSSFTDSFGPHESRVYLINPGGSKPPVVVNDTYETRIGDSRLDIPAARGVLANDIDPNGGSLTASLLSGVSHGALIFNSDGSFIYQPGSGYVGSDSFTYQAFDGASYTTGTVLLRSNYPIIQNTPPAAVDDSYSMKVNSTLTVNAPGVLANDSDFDGDPLAAVLVSGVSNGALTLNSDGSFTYTPFAGFVGSDSFTYRAFDGQDYSAAAIVSLTVNPNSPPVASGNSYSMGQDHVLTINAPGILANDSDSDGDPLTAVLETNVVNGALALNGDGSFTYAPAPGFIGIDSFTYRAFDGEVYSPAATVSIAVYPMGVGAYSYDFPNLTAVDAGTGTGAGYVAGSDFDIVAGRATPSMISGRFRVGNGTVGADWTTENTNGQFTDMALVNQVRGAGVYVARTDGAPGTSSNRGIVFGVQDKRNYFAVKLHNSLWRPAVNASASIEIVRVINGVETILAWADITATSENIGSDDIEVTIEWTPGASDAGVASIHVLWRSANLQVTHFDDTFANIDLSSVGWTSGRFGIREDGGFAGNVYVRHLSYTPLPPPPLSIAGTGSDDVFYLRRSANGGGIEIWRGPAANGAPDHVYAFGTYASLTLQSGAGNDWLIVDYSNGDPVLPFGVMFEAGSGQNQLILVGLDAGDHLVVETGRVSVNGSPIIHAGASGVWVDRPNVGSSVELASLHIDAGGRIGLMPGAGIVLVTAELIISGDGSLDLADNAMVVQGGELSAINDLVVSARAGGSWSGSGIHSSSAAAQPGRALGIRPDGDDVRVAFTWAGDANLDGAVNIADLGILAANWQQNGRGWWQGDFNYDGVVNIADLGILAANWQQQVDVLALAAALGGSAPAAAEANKAGDSNEIVSLNETVDSNEIVDSISPDSDDHPPDPQPRGGQTAPDQSQSGGRRLITAQMPPHAGSQKVETIDSRGHGATEMLREEAADDESPIKALRTPRRNGGS